MTKTPKSTAREKKLAQIREWFSRHKDDYDPRSPESPPQVWSEYFEWLLVEVEDATAARAALAHATGR